MMMVVLIMKIEEDREEGEDMSEVATGPATTPSQVPSQGDENSDAVDDDDGGRWWGREREGEDESDIAAKSEWGLWACLRWAVS